MARLGLDREVIGDGKLAVSEIATNALRHARPGPGSTVVPSELWIWARTVPAPQLVVSVFDGARAALPRIGGAELLDEFGKGLALLGEFTAEWGHAPSRSLLAERPATGKTVWFALPLPSTWPGITYTVHPGAAAQGLQRLLTRRGFRSRCTSDAHGLSVLELPSLNVWVFPGRFSWQAEPGRHTRRPLIDLQETAEHLVRHLEGGALIRQGGHFKDKIKRT